LIDDIVWTHLGGWEIGFKYPMITKLMPRRIPDYPDAYSGWNYIASFGSFISLIATVLFLYIVFELLTNEEKAVEHGTKEYFLSDPKTKYATTLEWNLSNPPAFHCFNNLPKQS
jgi:heme/copper-type cytochrome/quinol oxidase subunit 1